MFCQTGAWNRSGILQHKTDLLAKRLIVKLRISVPSILTVPGDGIVEARNQADDRRLATPCRADKCRDLSRLDLEADIFQDRLVRGVPKRNFVKFDFALEAPWRAARRQVTHPAFGFQNLADPLEPHARL